MHEKSFEIGHPKHGRSWTEKALRERHPGAFVSDPETHAAHDANGRDMHGLADWPNGQLFASGEATTAIVPIGNGISGTENRTCYPVPAIPAPSWHLPDDPFAPTPVKGNQAVTQPHQPDYSSVPALFPRGAQTLSQHVPPKRVLPFNDAPSSGSMDDFASGSGPMIKTSQGLTLNPAFKATLSNDTAAAPPFAEHHACRTYRRMPLHATLPTASECSYKVQQQASQQQAATSMPVANGPYGGLIMPSHSAVLSRTGSARPPPPPMGAVFNPKAVKMPGCPLLPPLEPQPGFWASELTSGGDVMGSIAGVSGNKKSYLPPLVPEKMASYCHVKHSRGETPDLSKDAVKSLVQVALSIMYE